MPFNQKSLQNLKTNVFSSTNQPAVRGRKLGGKNRRTIINEYLEANDENGLTIGENIMIATIARLRESGNVEQLIKLLSYLELKPADGAGVAAGVDAGLGEADFTPAELSELVGLRSRIKAIMQGAKDRMSGISDAEVL